MKLYLLLLFFGTVWLQAAESSAGIITLTATQDAGLRGDNKNSTEGLDDKLLTEEQDPSHRI